MGGGYAGVLNTRRTATTSCRTIDARLRHEHRSGERDVQHARTSRGATADQLTEARELYALLTGRVTPIPRHRAARRRHRQVRLPRRPGAQVEQDEFGAFIAGLVARHADADAQRRPALGPAAAVHAGRQHLVDRRRSKTSAASRASGDGPGGRGVQHVQAGAAAGHADPGLRPASIRATPAYKTDWFNFAPNVGVAWRPNVQGGWLRGAPRRSGAGDDPRRLLAQLQPGAHRPVHGQRRRQPRRHDCGVTRNLRHRLSARAARANRRRCSSASVRAWARRLPEAPVYPIAATTANSVNIFPQDRTSRRRACIPYSVGLQRSHRPGHGVRSPLRRQPEH